MSYFALAERSDLVPPGRVISSHELLVAATYVVLQTSQTSTSELPKTKQFYERQLSGVRILFEGRLSGTGDYSPGKEGSVQGFQETRVTPTRPRNGDFRNEAKFLA